MNRNLLVGREKNLMKNILFIHSSSELYGSDKSLLNIVKNIDKKIFNVHVILPCDGPLVDKMNELENVDVEIYDIAILRRKNLSLKGLIVYFSKLINSVKYLKSYIKSNDIDLVDTNTAVVFPGAIAAKKCNVKSSWHIREIISNNFENNVISFMMNRYADKIIANSKATGNSLKINKNKLEVVYNAIEEKKIDLIQGDRKTYNAIGMAGRINRWKGQKLFVDAASIVHNKYPNLKFYIAGDVYKGEENIKAELVEHIKQLGLSDTVILLGQVNDMSQFYSNIDIFVLPSIKPEPFGLVIIEAMQYEVPVIATNHGGPTEIINDGIDGYLVDYNKPDEMARKIEELMGNSNKRCIMGKKAKEKEESNFSVQSMVHNLEKIYNNM